MRGGQGHRQRLEDPEIPRYTPYHVPHRTEIAGFMSFLHGDMRFYNNVFVQQPVPDALVQVGEKLGSDEWDDGNFTVGVFPYDDYPTQAEWEKEFEGYCGMGSAPSDRYYMHLPVWAAGNAYLNGARPWRKESDARVFSDNVAALRLREKDGRWTLETNLDALLGEVRGERITTETLGIAFEPEQPFENPDGSPIAFDTDLFGDATGNSPAVGPFARWKSVIEL